MAVDVRAPDVCTAGAGAFTAAFVAAGGAAAVDCLGDDSGAVTAEVIPREDRRVGVAIC